MEALFLKVVNMSITSGYVILAVLVIRLLLRKAPRKYAYLLWSVVGFRLCCPVSFQSVFSLFSLKFFHLAEVQSNGGQTLQYVPENIGLMKQPEVNVGITAVNQVINRSFPSASSMTSVNPMQIWIFLATWIWCVGIVAFFFYSLISWFRLRRRVDNAVRLENNVYQSDAVRSPFILGFISPKIYIPFGLDASTLHYVLAHERYHLKRKDYLVKAVAFLILMIHWMNPLCWLAFILMSRDLEMSCDENVLSEEENIKKAYSRTLLSFAVNRRFPAPTPLAFSETGVKGRILNVLKWQKPKRWVTILAMILCVIVVTACAANPANTETETLMAETTEATETTAFEDAMQAAILSYNADRYFQGAIQCANYVTLASETKNNTVTVYAMVLYMSFDVNDGVLEEVSGGHTPSVLTFDISSEGEYRLMDYWEPRDGSYYVEDIREKFPEIIQDMALDTQSAILPQTRDCYAQAVAQANVDPAVRIEQLLDILTATPENSEDPEEHISAHALEYRELSYYGQYTQQYISEHSEESGLKGEILRRLEEEF